MHKIIKTQTQWRKELGEEAFHVLREKGTERPFSGKYWNCAEEGVYHCGACGEPLFEAKTKFDAGCGWPSYYQPISHQAVQEQPDYSHNMQRVEVLCHSCGSHLGHVFPDGPAPTGLRYCINSISLDLKKE